MSLKSCFSVLSWRLAFLLVVYSISNDFNHFLMYLLFASSSAQCNFAQAFGTYFAIGAASQIVLKLVSGPIADGAGLRIIVLLDVLVGTQVALQLALFLAEFQSIWVIIAIQTVLWNSCLLSQTLILKIAKMHLDVAQVRGQLVNTTQSQALNLMQAWGSFLSTIGMGVASFSAYWLGTHNKWSFERVKWLMYGISLGATTLTGVLALSLPRSFIDMAECKACVLKGFLIKGTLHAQESKPLLEGSAPSASPARNRLAYVRSGLACIWSDVVLFYTAALFTCAFMYQYLVYVALTLAESKSQSSTAGPLDVANFCGGQVLLLFLQAAALNAVYIVGSAVYGAVVPHVTARQVFLWLTPSGNVLLAAGTLALIRPLPSMGSSFILAGLSFFSYAFYLYALNAGLGHVREQFAGLYVGVLGVASSLVMLVPALLTAFAVPKPFIVFLSVATCFVEAGLAIRLGMHLSLAVSIVMD